MDIELRMCQYSEAWVAKYHRKEVRTCYHCWIYSLIPWEKMIQKRQLGNPVIPCCQDFEAPNNYSCPSCFQVDRIWVEIESTRSY